MNTFTGNAHAGFISRKIWLAGLMLTVFAAWRYHSGCLAYADGKDSNAEKAAFLDGDATTEGVDEEALQNLVRRAGETHSNALGHTNCFILSAMAERTEEWHNASRSPESYKRSR